MKGLGLRQLRRRQLFLPEELQGDAEGVTPLHPHVKPASTVRELPWHQKAAGLDARHVPPEELGKTRKGMRLKGKECRKISACA